MMLRRISFGKLRKVGMLMVTGRKEAMIERFRVVMRWNLSFVGESGGASWDSREKFVV